MNELERWQRDNEDYLARSMLWLRMRLAQQILSNSPKSSSQSESHSQQVAKAAQAMEAKVAQMQPLPALLLLSQRFRLSPFEQNVLLLCTAIELDTRISALCGRAQANPNRPYPTFALALSLFDQPAWDVLSPEQPLRYWRLIEINQPGVQPLTTSPLRADERILNYIKGLNYLDDRLAPLLIPPDAQRNIHLPPSQEDKVQAIAHHIEQSAQQPTPPVIQLIGQDSASKQLTARKAAAQLNLHLYRLPVELLPTQISELETFTRLWQRESLLLPIVLYLDAHGDSPTLRENQLSLLRHFLSRNSGLFFLSTREIRHHLNRPTIAVDIEKPTALEQQSLWADAIGAVPGDIPNQLASQFNLNSTTIQQIAQAVLTDSHKSDRPLPEQLWNACLSSTRPQLDVLAERLDPKATWEAIVLPAEETNLLQQIAEQVRQRSTVYEDWGFHKRMNRGLGITALFAGDSGTGKTMGAEVIANELRLNLYRIDLSAVVSKYIGETEKNLRRLFDAAEDGGAILFFDEADALFGKRSEVKDSHDRYANIEINYLLQRMEAYRGLAILATNMKSAMDNAFMRRLRFIVTFPFPGAAERRSIWEKVFPPETPTEKLDFSRLSRLNLTGASINSIALNAAFLAAHQQTPVTMPLLLQAARTEFRKLDRPINEADFRWQEPTGAEV